MRKDSPPTPTPSPRLVKATLGLVLFQVLGMLIPLLTLPVLARALGVEVFGQVMLAQSLVLLGLVFVDAGFNTESQRRVAVAHDSLQAVQALLDNLLARAVCAAPVVVILLLIAALWPKLPLSYVGYSLCLLVGTLVFPQWWYVAKQMGWRMGVAAVAGRLFSAALILWWVHTEQDGAWAALAASLASVFSGLWMSPVLVRGWREHRGQLNWRSWTSYLQAVRVNVFSGFFASASSAVPVLVLGYWAGPIQTGLFSAADRLTRAAAYVLGFIEQSLMGFLASKGRSSGLPESSGAADPSPHSLGAVRKKLLWGLLAVVAMGCMVMAWLAPFVLELLYGAAFSGATVLFRILLLWLFLYGARKALVSFYWSSTGALAKASRLQWLEAAWVTMACCAGAYFAAAPGVALAMCSSELLLIGAFLKWHQDGLD